MEVAKRTLKSALELTPGDKSVRMALQMCAAIDSKNKATSASFSKNIFGGGRRSPLFHQMRVCTRMLHACPRRSYVYVL